MLDLYEVYENTLEEMCDPDVEPFYSKYSSYLHKLNEIATSTGELVEGSLFNDNLLKDLPTEPVVHLRHRRRNFARFVTTGRDLLEIGFNAGHSALLALVANPLLAYTGIDVGRYAYTSLCYAFLKKEFGNRINLHLGDSRDLLPRSAAGKFDRFHIDGGHSPLVGHSDLANTIKLAEINSLILFDDATAKHAVSVISFYVLTGHLRREELPGFWECGANVTLADQALLRVCRKL